MLCSFLYQWLISHIFRDMSMVEKMDGHAWCQRLVALTDKFILWYPLKLDREMVTSTIGICQTSHLLDQGVA